MAPARRRAALWRLALGVPLAGAAWFGFGLAMDEAAWTLLSEEDYFYWAERTLEGDHPIGLLVALTSFAGLLGGTLLAAWALHGRTPLALLGPPGRAARDFGRTAVVVAVVYALMFAAWAMVHDSTPGLEPRRWALYAVPALLLLLVQTGAEEFAFRGYLQGQLAARFRSPVAWALLPSLAFGAVHYDPTLPGANALIYCASSAVFGLVAADLTARTGTLGAAWGLHWANNAFALLILGLPDDLSGLSLRLTPYLVSDPVSVLDVALGSASLLAVWALVARRVARP